MRRILFFLPIILLLVLPAGTSAEPRVHLSWDSCSGPLTKVLVPGETSATIYVTMSGIDVPHRGVVASFHLAGNDWRVCPEFADPYAQPPADAWRFDPAGCEGTSRASFDMTGSGAGAGCPWIAPAAAGLEVHGTSLFNESDLGSVLVTAGLAYPDTPELTPDPNETVFVFAVRFDLSNAASGDPGDGRCGGLEQTLLASNVMNFPFPSSNFCVIGSVGQNQLVEATSGVVVDVAPDPSYLTIDAHAVPVVARTWGQIKSQYR